MTTVTTLQHKQEVQKKIDKIEQEFHTDWAKVDRAYHDMKVSGGLQRFEQDRALQEQLKWG